MANELTDPAALRWLAREFAAHPERELLCYVDSLDGVRLAEQAFAEAAEAAEAVEAAGSPGSAEASGAVALDESAHISALSDQHAFLRVDPASDLAVGDLVALGVSHPCMTLDRWRLFLLVDEDYDVIGGARTYF